MVYKDIVRLSRLGHIQAMVRCKGIAPRSKSFDKKANAEKWARDLETQVDVSGFVADSKLTEQTTWATSSPATGMRST